MTSYSWDYDGPKRLDNFFDHWFVRSALVPGWSASQGGPGASSHTRDDQTQKYLRRPCVSNPAGGPQDTSAAEVHKLRAKLSLAEVDLVRRREFKRLQERAAVDEKLRVMGINNEIKRNWGWPFNQDVPPRDGDQYKEKIPDEPQLFPKKPEPDWDKEWDREPFGKFMLGEDGKDGFKSWVGPFGWQEGYVKWFDEEKEDGKITREAGYYWTGPEKQPTLLEQFVWKPATRAGPAAVAAAGANKAVDAIALGRPFETPEELQRKRVYEKNIKVKNLITGQEKPISLGSGKFFDNDVEVRDPLTGVPIYSYKQKHHTVTSSRGHGTMDKKELLKRKENKLKTMNEQVANFDNDIGNLEHDINKTEEKFHSKELPATMARDKITGFEAEKKKLEKQRAEYEIRIRREKREIKALQTELELVEAGKGTLLPRSLMLAMPKDAIEAVKTAEGAVKQVFGIEDKEDDEFYSSDSGAEENDDGGDVLGWITGHDKQKRKGLKTEKYFGQNLIDPATGKIDEAVLKRKNKDLIARYKETNKAVADVYLSRSDGKSKYETVTFVPPAKRNAERRIRAEQQEVVNGLVQKALNHETKTDLEKWASDESRKQSTFGSTMHIQPKPAMRTIQVKDGSYMTMKTFEPPPTERLDKFSGKPLPKSAVPATCSSGKVVGGGYQDPRFELVGWGPEDEEHFLDKELTMRTGFSNRSADKFVPAALQFAGARVNSREPEALDRGPLKPGLVRDRKYTPGPRTEGNAVA